MTRLVSSLVLLALVAGCASTSTQKRAESGTADAAAKPALMIADAVKREQGVLPLKEVVFPDEAFTAKVESTGTPTVTPHERFFHVQIPVGLVEDLSCFVYPVHLDAGAALNGFIESVTEDMEVAQLATTEITPVGIDPMVVMHARYLVQGEGGKQQGILKVAVRPAPDASLLCFHDEPGYNQMFSRMVQTFARSLTPAESDETEADFAEVQVVKIGETPVGFDRRRFLEAKAGGRVDEVIGMMLLPRSPTELVAQDHSKVTITDHDGRVVSIRIFEATGGEEEVDLTVTRQKGNEYAYEGKISGKAVKGTFKSTDKKGLPGDELLERFIVTQLLTGQAESYVHEQYDPEMDIQKPMQLKVTRNAAHPRGVTVSFGQMAIQGQVDAKGLMEKASVSFGPATMTIERVTTQGSP